ncbi:MAG: sigma-70 family RNA polymerase sigma factor [Deltaproteobacteria bacterium]|nr:sigma-70 family RNA polymerase sigma factor [Deltaproteobacteria bacterium]
MAALLVRRVGLGRLEAVEDAVQAALLAATTAWLEDVPREPRAWLYRVAHNHLVGVLRQEGGHRRILEGVQAEEETQAPNEAFFEGEIEDELLRMLFVCCDDELPVESRLVLALKTLCGFSVEEIAFRLFTSEANVYKRLARARERLREAELDTDTPPLESLRFRLPSVHAVIYLLFNEGYLSIDPEQAIRVELCDEAIRLGELLATHPVGAGPTSFALLALMHLHAARLTARQDAAGGLLLLEEQARRLDPDHFQRGASWLAKAADGDELTRYHLEAGIAAEHCFAPSFAETRWGAIAELYAMLERIAPSPLHTLNRAIALAEAEGPVAGLASLQGAVPPAWLEGHYLWDAVLSDLHRRAGHPEVAAQHREAALLAAPSQAVRRLLERRLSQEV